MNKQPIGIFDSGVGGLTIARAVANLLPNEKIIYLGDTAHTPWGDKSSISISRYTSRICEVLLKSNCKAIVMACNTASAVSLDIATKITKNKAALIDVITPVANYVATNFSNKNIGIIATKQTIASNFYINKIRQLNNTINVQPLATPLLVPLIEENFIAHKATNLILQDYLTNEKLKDINALILGCTHYPIIKSIIEKFYNNNIEIIDSANLTAEYLKQNLIENNLLADTNEPNHEFYISDLSQCFEKIASTFFNSSINLEYFPLWD